MNLRTKTCDKKQVLHSVPDRIRQGKVDKRLDVQMVHERKPRVVTAGQGIGRQPIYRTTHKMSAVKEGTFYGWLLQVTDISKFRLEQKISVSRHILERITGLDYNSRRGLHFMSR